MAKFHGSSLELWWDNGHGGWATLLALLFILLWHSSKRFSFVSRFPSAFSSASTSTSASASASASSSALALHSDATTSRSRAPHLGISEIVTDEDLMFLIETLEEKISEDEIWQNVIEKRNDNLFYSAKCCDPKDGPVKYLSVTVFENCSPEMLRDFYMDNDYRKMWDKTLLDHKQLQVDENSGVEVGRTIKKFPLLTPREYVLGWRLWEGKDKTFYCFIKECEHPFAPRQKDYVRVGFFRSGWRIKKVPDRNACEIKMFHQEDAGLNVKMAKLVFAKGIWSYVCKMENALRKYPTIRHPQSSSAANAVTLVKKVPHGLETTNGVTLQATFGASAVDGSVTGREKKLSKRPSRKMVAKGLLLLGGVVCLSRGHSSLGAKVVMAYVLTKLRKRGASSSGSA
ncbi:uncharacterized protein LOC107428111 [Ziziphus jujuba]|uniref:Uncharacterized protein LOC107428111 n=1 Tax=Ziziphus jujuba TaxID=326968 RepID=A0A6P4AH94_ZIZJJ|nr:uncharacterized protein LOC107428111 [Ziziphus jujuba]